MVTIKDLAEASGLSAASIYRLIYAGSPPASVLPDHYLWQDSEKAELIKLINERPRKGRQLKKKGGK